MVRLPLVRRVIAVNMMIDGGFVASGRADNVAGDGLIACAENVEVRLELENVDIVLIVVYVISPTTIAYIQH